MIDATLPTLALQLGLTARDLAEIGGFNEKLARDLLTGKATKWHDNVAAALLDIQDDMEAIIDEMVSDVQGGKGALFVCRTNEQCRANYPDWPGRGKAAGGFRGTQHMAAAAAQDILAEVHDIEVDIYFVAAD